MLAIRLLLPNAGLFFLFFPRHNGVKRWKRDMSCVGKAETVYGNIDIVWGSTFADFSALCYPRALVPCAGGSTMHDSSDSQPC